MQFKYVSTQPDGNIFEGELEAGSTAEVLSFLSKRNLKPISVKRVGGGFASKNINLFGGQITLGDQIFLSRYLALMLKIGTSLLQAINILIEDFKRPVVKDFLIEVRSNLERGQQFYVAFAKHPKFFSQVYINLVKAGEASGNLENVFDNMSTSLAKEKSLRDQVRGALVYPIILLCSSLLILIFLITFALPKIAKVFLESGFQPPLFSRIVFSFGLFFSKFGIYLLIIFVLGLIFFVYLYRNSIFFKRLVESILKELPVIKDLMKKMAIQRFAATLASLIKASIPITDALEITADAVGHVELKDALIRISRDGLAKGLTVGEAFKRETFFPQTIVNLIAISERAGHIDEILQTLADFYTSEIDGSLKALISFLEPMMLLGIGFMIGLITLSVIMPIYQLTTQF